MSNQAKTEVTKKPEPKPQAASSSSTATTPMKATSNFQFDLPPSESREQLVNNDYLADVVFKVGQSGTLMYAHKIVITMASEVFFAQFNGQFTEAQQDTHKEPITIPDIEPDVLLEVLRYMYCRQATLTPRNMLDVYYAAEKYMLGGLQILFEHVFFQETNEDNVLSVFQHNRRYGFAMVDQFCLGMICENPLKFFEQKDFQKLDHTALELIATHKVINCEVNQLEKAVKQWELNNGASDIVLEPRPWLCRKLNFFNVAAYNSSVDTHIRLKVQSPIALYGLGIFVGVKYDSFIPYCTVTIDLKIDDVIQMSKLVTVSNELETCDLMFEKIIIDKTCTIKVEFKKSFNLKHIDMFYLAGIGLTDVLGNTNLTVEWANNTGKNCVAYLFCQVADEALEGIGKVSGNICNK